jgi:hypothetical protein
MGLATAVNRRAVRRRGRRMNAPRFPAGTRRAWTAISAALRPVEDLKSVSCGAILNPPRQKRPRDAGFLAKCRDRTAELWAAITAR